MAELDTPAYAVAYDPSGDAVWFAEVGRGGPDRLWQAKESTGELTSFPLPDVEYNGFTTHLHVSDDGAVWVSLPYVLVRLDPATGSSKSLTFPKEAEEDALPAASDPGAPLPGTWISELAVVGSSVMVARMNMPYLSVVDATPTESRGPSLPDGYAGARSMARGPMAGSTCCQPWTRMVPSWAYGATGPNQWHRSIRSGWSRTRTVS